MMPIGTVRKIFNEKIKKANKEGNEEKISILEGFDLMLSCFEDALEEGYASPIEVAMEATELNNSLDEILEEL